jgi:hypothetical protein
VKKGHINIKCPFCGENDPSEHLGIEIVGKHIGRWACWRNIQHSGPNPRALLMKILHCSWDAADSLLSDVSSFDDLKERLQRSDNPIIPLVKVGEPPQVEKEEGLKLLSRIGCADRFFNYLRKRKYPTNEHEALVKEYNLYGALIGRFKNRIVFPIVENRKLVGYTGRCVDGGMLRYLSEPGPIVKKTLLWYDELASLSLNGLHDDSTSPFARCIVITEGPFDAMRVDWTFKKYDLPHRATCLFGVSWTAEQLHRIRSIAHLGKIVILFDRAATANALLLQSKLRDIHPTVMWPCEGRKDPGEMSEDEVLALFGE